jgi:hypothetical protein
VCIDARRMVVLAPGQSERLLEILRRPSPGLLRRASLLPSAGGVVALQVARLIRESNAVDMRAFTDRAALVEWLGELLTPEEAARLLVFLGEPE